MVIIQPLIVAAFLEAGLWLCSIKIPCNGNSAQSNGLGGPTELKTHLPATHGELLIDIIREELFYGGQPPYNCHSALVDSSVKEEQKAHQTKGDS